MKKSTVIFILAGAVASLLALLTLSGCGKEESSTTGYECDLTAESIIPAPSGKPQHIYFYRDT
jgi:ABC-type uncharacterized transport system auxiliary subunit